MTLNKMSLYEAAEWNDKNVGLMFFSAMDTIKGNKRSIVISRSSFANTGVHSGHWLGDNNAQWIDTYYSIPGTRGC